MNFSSSYLTAKSNDCYLSVVVTVQVDEGTSNLSVMVDDCIFLLAVVWAIE